MAASMSHGHNEAKLAMRESRCWDGQSEGGGWRRSVYEWMALARKSHTFPATTADLSARTRRILDSPIYSVSTRVHRHVKVSTCPAGCSTVFRLGGQAATKKCETCGLGFWFCVVGPLTQCVLFSGFGIFGRSALSLWHDVCDHGGDKQYATNDRNDHRGS